MAPKPPEVGSNIYVQNFIRSRNYDFNPQVSELIGRICGVEGALTMRDSSVGFCNELLAAFKGTSLYGKVDRLCLASRIGLTNELSLLDSCNTKRASANKMERGYRCFVRPNSTLLSLREGEIRIYEDADRVAEAFGKKPVQRSLAYVIDMKLKSGLCIPLHTSSRLKGFLFLNSVESETFNDLADEDYAVLNVIGMVAKLAILTEAKADDEYASVASQAGNRLMGHLFDEDELASQIQSLSKAMTGEVWRPKVMTEGDCSFLYSPSTLSYLALKICSTFYCSAKDFPEAITIACQDGETVEARIPMSDKIHSPSLERYRAQVEALGTQLAYLNVSLVPGVNCVAIRFPFDPVTVQSEDELYSV